MWFLWLWHLIGSGRRCEGSIFLATPRRQEVAVASFRCSSKRSSSESKVVCSAHKKHSLTAKDFMMNNSLRPPCWIFLAPERALFCWKWWLEAYLQFEQYLSCNPWFWIIGKSGIVWRIGSPLLGQSFGFKIQRWWMYTRNQLWIPLSRS